MWMISSSVALLLAVGGACATARHMSARNLELQSPPQFFFGRASDPRIVPLVRVGNGAEQMSELTMFELVEEGRRLRLLSRVELKNAGVAISYVFLTTRYVLTMDERSGIGTTANCLVIYDLQRGESVALSLEEFLSKESIALLGSDGLDAYPGRVWRVFGRGLFDAKKLLYYPSTLRECRDHEVPCIEVDLRSMVAGHLEVVPEKLPGAVDPKHDWSIEWQWRQRDERTAGHVKSEKFAYPDHITGIVDLRRADRQLIKFLGSRKQMSFRRDAKTGDYLLDEKSGGK